MMSLNYPRKLYYLIGVTLAAFFAATSIVQAQTVNLAAVLDFDGDKRTDYAVVRFVLHPRGFDNYDWYIQRSSDGGMTALRFGSQTLGDQIVPADYDGDGKWDIAVWRSPEPLGAQAYYYIMRSRTNDVQVIPWGVTGDDSRQTQDFDGDGKADPTVVRSNNGLRYWYSLLSATNELRAVQFGNGFDRLLRGDFDGDGEADPAVWRIGFLGGTPRDTFFILRSSDGQVEAHTFGNSDTDYVVPGDFDGDRKTDLAVVRNINNQFLWYWRRSSDGTVVGQQFGSSLGNFENGVPGDYDGDGTTDLATWRSTGGSNPAYFYVNRSRDGFTYMQWGLSTVDNPLATRLQIR